MPRYAVGNSVTYRGQCHMPWHLGIAHDIRHDMPANDCRGEAHGKRDGNPRGTSR